MTLLEWVAVVVATLALEDAAAQEQPAQGGDDEQSEGGFDLCLRVDGNGWGGGWVFGVGRYRGDDLEWFRTFSYGSRPKRSLRRPDVIVLERRSPDPEETYDLPAGHLVFTCEAGHRRLDLSMTEAASMAFVAWLEAGPPGQHLVA